ncbi:MAG: response regulator [Candidatus Omnitrophica bacterium]|nr:response regulator [Candidatus Omnitrophota bacterium]
MADKIKVAIVDDEIEYVKDLAKGLEIMGYEVVTAVNGAGAIELINNKKPDVVLCDYKLDDMDGTKVIEATKPSNQNTLYMMVTAYYDESYNEIFRKAGADQIVYKPIQLAEIDEAIRKGAKKGGR